MSVDALVKPLGIPTSRLNDIVLKRRGVTPGTAMRLARYFGGDARSWLCSSHGGYFSRVRVPTIDPKPPDGHPETGHSTIEKATLKLSRTAWNQAIMVRNS